MVLSILLDQSKSLNTAQQGCMIAVFLGLNLSLNMMGKYVLGTSGFRFAIALTICHLVSSTICLAFIFYSRPSSLSNETKASESGASRDL